MAKHCSAEYIERKLKDYKRYKMAATPRVAAVLIPILPTENECSIIFTKRRRDLNHHGGEVSFPGGMSDDGDENLRTTALRETDEEIGIKPSDVHLLGAFDDELSKWGHRVTPFVGVVKSTDFILQESEVERLYQVPVSHLMRDDVYYTENWMRNGAVRPVHFYKYNDDIIWGLTAKIINKFLCYMTK